MSESNHSPKWCNSNFSGASVKTEDFPEGLGLVVDTTGKEAIENYLPNPSGELHDLIRRFGFVLLNAVNGMERLDIEPAKRGDEYTLFHLDSESEYISGLRMKKPRKAPTVFVSAKEAIEILKRSLQGREAPADQWNRIVEKSLFEGWDRLIKTSEDTSSEEGVRKEAREFAHELLGHAQAIRAEATTTVMVDWTEFPQGFLLYGRRGFDFNRGKLIHGCFPERGAMTSLDTGGELQIFRFQRNWFLPESSGEVKSWI